MEKKTLADYIKGYPQVDIYLLAKYIDKKGNKYYLCKQPGHNNYYYMKGDYVLDKQYICEDHMEKLSIEILNHPNDQEVKNKIREQESYKHFVKFIKNKTGEDLE